MRIATVNHTEMAWQLTTLWVAVCSTAQSMLGCSPTEALHVGIMEEMPTEFPEQVERCSHLKGSNTRICDLIHEPPPGWV
jgi:hypothetical protein